ncbi:MAG: reverse transcriptase-like protein [Candidatus Nanopelagicus sp.]
MPANFGQNLMARHFVITADGGSRGNPGPAAFGAVVYENEKVVKEIGAAIGVASNNVAEYQGLIAGLKAANEIDPAATILVKMDSKLVIEQMSGRWKVKHPNMKELAKQAFATHDPKLVSYQWIPREENSHADSILNDVLDSQM